MAKRVIIRSQKNWTVLDETDFLRVSELVDYHEHRHPRIPDPRRSVISVFGQGIEGRAYYVYQTRTGTVVIERLFKSVEEAVVKSTEGDGDEE